ncbi:MAG: hypothetical protein U0R17_04255 [Acidimicrobiia bacterium]
MKTAIDDDKARIMSFPLERLSAVPTQQGDIVIVDVTDPSQKELDQLKETLGSKWRGASYRGVLAGAQQATPEETAKPISRPNVPKAFQKAVGHTRDLDDAGGQRAGVPQRPLMKFSSR